MDSRISRLIKSLHLAPLPLESGYLAEVGESILVTDGLPIQSHVYYMLTADRPINYLHHLKSDDTHILIEGGPLDYYIFTPGNPPKKITMGRNVELGETPVISVPAGSWKAIVLKGEYGLMCNVLTPAFAPDRVTIGAGQEWIDQWTTPELPPKFLKALIGPNFINANAID